MSRLRTRALLAALALAVFAPLVRAQAPDPNAYPMPYHEVPGWAKLPDGRHFGQVIGVYPATDGKHVWVFERCGNRYCTDSPVAPIDEFDASGKLVRSFGAGLFVFPHGLWVDAKGDIWVTDADMKDGKGNQVWKFSPTGKVLMTLGKKGVAGDGPGEFNKPTFAVTAKDGSIFVADGHGNSRIIKLSADGKFIKAWGRKGSAPGEFATPHALALDSQGRLFVADRENNRLQIFDQDGKFLAEWKQFGKPSGLYIDKHDTMYVTDSEFEPRVQSRIPARHPHRQRQNRQGDGVHPRSESAASRQRPRHRQLPRRHRRRRRRQCLWRRDDRARAGEVEQALIHALCLAARLHCPARTRRALEAGRGAGVAGARDHRDPHAPPGRGGTGGAVRKRRARRRYALRHAAPHQPLRHGRARGAGHGPHARDAARGRRDAGLPQAARAAGRLARGDATCCRFSRPCWR